MICHYLNKIEHGSYARYALLDENEIQCGEAHFPLGPLWHGGITLSYQGRTTCVSPSHFGIIQASSSTGEMTISYCEQILGTVSRLKQRFHIKPPFFQAYSMSCMGQEHRAYPVGLGDDGHAICIYERQTSGEETLIAQAQRPVETYNWLRRYTIHAINEKAEYIALIYILYIEYVHGGHRMEKPTSECREIEMSVTHDEWLKSRYDPDFPYRGKPLSNPFSAARKFDL